MKLIFTPMISQSLDKLREILQNAKVSEQVADQICADVKNNIERLPNANKFIIENDQLVALNVEQGEYSIQFPSMSFFMDDVRDMSLSKYLTQNEDQLDALLQQSYLYTFPEQVPFEIHRLNQLIVENYSEKRQICLDDFQINQGLLDLRRSGISDLKCDFALDVFADDIFSVNFSFNPLNLRDIEDFVSQLPNLKQIVIEGIPLDAEILTRLNAKYNVLLVNEDSLSELEVVPLEALPHLPQENNCKTIYSVFTITNEVFNAFAKFLQILKPLHLICPFSSDFDFSLLIQIPRINNEILRLFSTPKQKKEKLAEFGVELSEFIFRTAFYIKSRDLNIQQSESGRLELKEEQNFALAFYPGVFCYSQATYSSSNVETGQNFLCILQKTTSGDLVLINIALKTLKHKFVFRNHFSTNLDIYLQKFQNEIKFKQIKFEFGSGKFNLIRSQQQERLERLEEPNAGFECTDFGITSFLYYLQNHKDKIVISDLKRKLNIQEAIALLYTRQVRQIFILPETDEIMQITVKNKKITEKYIIILDKQKEHYEAGQEIDLEDGEYVICNDQIIHIM